MASSSEPESAKRKLKFDNAPRKPRILLAVCGSVAAKKFEILCCDFSRWAEVRIVLTHSALRFVDKKSFPKDVFIFWDEHEWDCWNKVGDRVLHIELSKWADIMVIAPLSANTLAKIAGGLCDNLLTCVVRSWDYSKPLFVAPSMNPCMWKNPFTEVHCMIIDELGITLIPPVSQRSSDGNYETGAMADPHTIFTTVKVYYDFMVLKKQHGMA